jgi:hypothetical protein
MISSPSSSSLSGDEDAPIPERRLTMKPPPTPRTPTIRVISQDEEEQRSRTRSVSDDVKVSDRPRLRKKSATAPPGGMGVPGYAPQPPRRAISARVGEMNTIQGRTPEQETYVTDPLAVRKVMDRKQEEQRKQQPQPPRPSPPQPPRHDEIRRKNQLTIKGQRIGSFSQKARVRKTLDDKKLGLLNTHIVDFESKGLLTSPTSLLSTPRELYPIPEKRSAGQEHLYVSPEDPTSPHSIAARSSIMSILSPRSQQSRRMRSRKKKRHTERQQIYIPGAIRLEQHPAQLRKGSVASLDPFEETTDTRGKRYSDMIVLNSLTMFFAELSVLEDATEACLDRYWRDTEPPPPRQVAKPSITSVQEMIAAPESQKVEKPQSLWSHRGSRFSFSSASSTASSPAPGTPGTPMRQRDRLKRLLTPGFGGLTK